MLNKLGLFCRKLRLEHREKLSDMSKKLSVSSAFLSKVENGKSKPPVSWKRKIVELYALNEKQKLKFNIAFFEALNYNNIDIKNYSAKIEI